MLNINDPESILKEVKSDDNLSRLRIDYDKYLVFNGKLKELIRKAIQAEFILPETVAQLVNRVVPINITGKIIDKLATVYKEVPVREPGDKNEADQELVDFYTKEMSFNRKMKFCNQMFKLYKHSLLEPYVDSYGVPRMRVLPSHTYTVLSDDMIDPSCPTCVVKLLHDDKEVKEQRFAIWTSERHWIVDGDGIIQTADMLAMNNPDGINPYGVLPFVYFKQSDDRLIPLPSEDIVSCNIIICLLLTDLCFASKYQAWSYLVLTGAESTNLTLNPNSIISLPLGPNGEKPTLETVKPEIDIDQMLRLIESNMSMLLTTNGLTVGDVTSQLTTGNAASGAAKMIDQSQSTELREDQVAYFREAEEDFWYLFAHKILPVWVASGILQPEYANAFSVDFELSIRYPELKPMVDDSQKIDQEIKKLNSGLTTRQRAIQAIDPELTLDQATLLIDEIDKESANQLTAIENNLPTQDPSIGSDDGEA